jgi:hypothetical protein
VRTRTFPGLRIGNAVDTRPAIQGTSAMMCRHEAVIYLNMPMYHVADLNQELASICTLIESLPAAERTKWDALEDRHLMFSAGLPEIEKAELLKRPYARGFDRLTGSAERRFWGP